MPFSAVEIIAHRGASHDAPENTVAAFQLAWEQKADAVELDIQLTKDGRIIAFHDDTTRRVAGVNRRVAQQTFEELRAIVVGPCKGAHIPSIEEVLATVPDGKRLFIEIKCGPEVLPALERSLKTSGKTPEQIVIMGFDLETMKQARERFPELAIYWVVSPKIWSLGTRPSVGELIAWAKSAGLDGLDVDARFAIDREFVSRVRDAGLTFHVWTVNDAKAARRLAALGVQGIITNRPLWLREQLESGMLPE